MTRLLDRIIELSELEQGDGDWPLARIDPEQALDEAIDLCEGLAAAAGRLRGALSP